MIRSLGSLGQEDGEILPERTGGWGGTQKSRSRKAEEKVEMTLSLETVILIKPLVSSTASVWTSKRLDYELEYL